MRILVLARDCNPDWPSLPVVAYKACKAIGEHAELVVATHMSNEPNLKRDAMGRCEIVYINNEYIARPMSRLGRIVRGGEFGRLDDGARNAIPAVSGV